MTALIRSSLAEIRSIYHGVVEELTRTGDHVLLLAHFGDFSQIKNDHLLRITESAVLEQGDKRLVMKRIYGVMIEMLQNMSIHAALDRDNHMHGFILLVRTPTHYLLESGNLVFESDAPALRRRMEDLLSMDSNQLRKAYIDTLCNEDFSQKGGAGLGLLTMAKRSSSPLVYSLAKLEKPFSYFRLSASLLID